MISRYIIFVMLYVTTQSFADQAAPADLITVKSEDMEINQQTGIHTLSGNVVITHHDIVISADIIQVTRTHGAVSRIMGSGTPLRFEQQLSNGELIRIDSREVDYKTRTWKIVLSGKVSMQRGHSKIEASSIEYNIRNKNYTASNSEDETSRVEFNYLGNCQKEGTAQLDSTACD